jgi:cobyrinic acid a,c-diamide synthase
VSHSCRALFIGAPASNSGKTTITAALAYYFRVKQGLKVQVFKVGPDFLDPMILERASGNQVLNLDLWMVGEAESRRLLSEASDKCDLILVEGAMGLFDGEPSGADLAEKFGLPLLVLIDATGMAQTLHAIGQGLLNFRKTIPAYGYVANNVVSERHMAMLGEPGSQPGYLGAIARETAAIFPSRHLGLTQACEIADLDSKLDRLASLIEESALANLPPLVEFQSAVARPIQARLENVTIGVAFDSAFSFIYAENLRLLEALGARLSFFSPLANEVCSQSVDALYLPGGYPELFLKTLADALETKAFIRRHHADGKPIYAECGGMLFLAEELSDLNGVTKQMLGIFPARACMHKRLQGLGHEVLEVDGQQMRGHTFHYSHLETDLKPRVYTRRRLDGTRGEAFYQVGNLVATYSHLYFPSNCDFAAKLFRSWP